MVQPTTNRPCAFWTERGVAIEGPWRPPTGEARSRRRARGGGQRLWQGARTMALAIVVVGAAGAGSARLWQGVRTALAPPVALMLAVPMTVRPGDSLWSLARRYGDPNAYILERVDTLARANRLPASAALSPGQRVLVPIENPAEIARLSRTVAAAGALARR